VTETPLKEHECRFAIAIHALQVRLQQNTAVVFEQSPDMSHSRPRLTTSVTRGIP
jgi:hypothetical protein